MAENEAVQGRREEEIEQKSSNVKQSEKISAKAVGAASRANVEPSESFVNSTLDPGAVGQSRRGRSKARRHYEQFGETIRYLTWDEWQELLDCIEDYRHKLMIRLMYHLGCRVGEFVRIQLKHLDFGRSSVFFPSENTKTGHRRSSHVPVGIMNEIKSMLKREGRMPKRNDDIRNPEEFLFGRRGRSVRRYTENRLRQIFQRYVERAGLSREYGTDSKGRKLHQITIHSLRHSHIMHHIHIHKLPLPVVQRQVGHRTLKATSVYLNPSDEDIAQAYEAASKKE